MSYWWSFIAGVFLCGALIGCAGVASGRADMVSVAATSLSGGLGVLALRLSWPWGGRMSDHETTLRGIAQHGTTGAIYEPSPNERAACLAGADALRAQPDVIEAIHKDVLARIREHITPRLNTPTQADVLNLLGHVNAAFSAAKDAALDASKEADRG